MPQFAHAETVPKSVEPGNIEKRFDKLETPKSTLRYIIPKMEGQKAPVDADKIKLTLSGITIEGSTVYSKADLEDYYAEFLSKEISAQTLFNIAAKITTKYGNDGYSLSRAIIPKQAFDKDGAAVKIEIIEGFIDAIFIEMTDADGKVLTDEKSAPKTFTDPLGFFETYKRNILAARPITAAVLERYLLLAKDLPGFDVKTVIKASPNNHRASTLTYQIIEEIPASGSLALDNRGTKSSGPHQISASLSAGNLTKLYENTTLSYIQTAQQHELKYFSFSQDWNLHAEGTKLNIKAVRSLSKPGTTTLQDLDYRSLSNTLSAAISHSIIRSRGENLTLEVDFTAKNSESFQLAKRSTDDRLRKTTLTTNYDYTDAWLGVQGVSQATFDLVKGVPIFHATSNDYSLNSRSDGRNDFFKAVLNLTRIQSLPDKWQLYFAAMGQRSAHGLLSGEECGVGGESFGRAYDSSEITGDHCAAFSVELRKSFQPNIPDVKYLQPYAFYDIGVTWNRLDTTGDDKKNSLASTGLGLRFGITDYVSGSFETALPLTRLVDDNAVDGDHPRYFFKLTASF
ncbi:MAG: ShlB/FhaC/HecB family hemolysin secretion/activation protein [Aestuariibacter sp.]|nr:ShlB/FhaC/HecB family hemolysin secretion/activation protein [Aestuariibacter sp.]